MRSVTHCRRIASRRDSRPAAHCVNTAGWSVMFNRLPIGPSRAVIAKRVRSITAQPVRFLAALIVVALLAIGPCGGILRAQEGDELRSSKTAADEQTAASNDNAAAGKSTPVTVVPAPPTAIPTNLFELIAAGGPLMLPIAACSLIAAVFGIERLVVLRKRRVIPKDFVVRFIDMLQNNELDRATALHLCEENGSPISHVFAHAVRKWGKPSVEVEQAVIDGGERQVSHLRSHLRILNAVATVSPLLGLLGTVIGMMICFNQIAGSSAMGKAEQLAGGIGVALITTAGGLGVAIPALILYMYFVGRVDALVMEMDHQAQKVVNLISAEGLAEPPPATTRSTTRRASGAAAATESRESRKAVPSPSAAGS